MANGIKFSSIEEGALRIGNANIAVRQNSVSNPSSYWTSIEPVKYGYTVYIDKPVNGPAIYTVKNDNELIALGNKLSGQTFSNINDCLAWFNSYEEGNRNLLLDSKFIVGDTEAINWRMSSYNTASIVEGLARYTVYNVASAGRLDRVISLEKGVYTVSIKAKTNAASFNLLMSSLVNAQLISNPYQLITDNFNILKWTFEVTDTASVTLRLYYGVSLQINEYIDVEWYKLEKGSAATPWRPAMEDPEYTMDKFVLSSEIPPIVTNGLVLNYDAGLIPSYPKGGTAINDVSGNGNNGTLVNGVGYSSEGGGSLSFDGVNDYVGKITVSNDSLDIKNAITMSVWIYAYSVSTLSYIISKNLSSGSADQQYSIYINSGGSLTIVINGRSLTGYVLPINTWVNICVTWDGTTIKCFINGVLINTGTYIGTMTFKPNFSIGRRAPSAYYFNGLISDVKIYNKALTEVEILQNYRASLKRFIPTDGLIMSLDPQNRITEGTQSVIARDISGYNNNAVLVNGITYAKDGGGSFVLDATDDYIVPTGRNIAIDTNNNKWSYYIAGVISFDVIDNKTYIKVQAIPSSSYLGIHQTVKPFLFEIDVIYTLSFYIRGTILPNYNYIMNSGVANSSIGHWILEGTLNTNDFIRATKTFYGNATMAASTGSYIMMRATKLDDSDWFEIKDVKVEYGPVATPFVTAEETRTDLKTITNGSISFWAKMDDTKNWLFMSNNILANLASFLLATNGTGNFYHSSMSPNTPITYINGVIKTNPNTDLKWQYIVMTGINLSSWDIFLIGTYGTQTNFKFNGKLSDIKFYNRVLTPTEVSNIFNATRQRYGI